jgi:hypothetical protein
VDWASRPVSRHAGGSVLLPVKLDLGPCCRLGTERARPPPARRRRTAVARLTSAGLQRAGSSPRLGRSAADEPDLEDSGATVTCNSRRDSGFQCAQSPRHRRRNIRSRSQWPGLELPRATVATTSRQGRSEIATATSPHDSPVTSLTPPSSSTGPTTLGFEFRRRRSQQQPSPPLCHPPSLSSFTMPRGPSADAVSRRAGEHKL